MSRFVFTEIPIFAQRSKLEKMKVLQVIFITFIFYFQFMTLTAQEKTGNKNLNYNVEYTQQAHYPEGDNAFFAFVSQKIVYNEEALNNRLSGEVIGFF